MNFFYKLLFECLVNWLIYEKRSMPGRNTVCISYPCKIPLSMSVFLQAKFSDPPPPFHYDQLPTRVRHDLPGLTST